MGFEACWRQDSRYCKRQAALDGGARGFAGGYLCGFTRDTVHFRNSIQVSKSHDTKAQKQTASDVIARGGTRQYARTRRHPTRRDEPCASNRALCVGIRGSQPAGCGNTRARGAIPRSGESRARQIGGRGRVSRVDALLKLHANSARKTVHLRYSMSRHSINGTKWHETSEVNRLACRHGTELRECINRNGNTADFGSTASSYKTSQSPLKHLIAAFAELFPNPVPAGICRALWGPAPHMHAFTRAYRARHVGFSTMRTLM